MTLPTAAGAATTSSVGYFEVRAAALADFIVDGFDGGWVTRPAGVASMCEVVTLLAPRAVVSRCVCLPVGRWTALLNNSPLGTDVGVLPSYAARELGCRGMRVVSTEDSATYPAHILEVYGPAGLPPLAIERSIVAAKSDGGRWVFETFGKPYPFEDQSAYVRRRKADRFTTDMLFDYLRALDVPVDAEPGWPGALLVERSP
ncbi:MAG: hypothetical protein LLG14_08335 [Nocardiaceae bacterium]|nr:hypothetical protein [Nocardiaceae bacterium]